MEVKLLSTKRFIILNFFLLGWYSTWWVYKTWKFFETKDNTDYQVPKRLVLGLGGYHYSLFIKIKRFACHYTSTNKFSCVGQYLIYFFINIYIGFYSLILDDSPDSSLIFFFVLNIIGSLVFLKPFQYLNSAIKDCGEYKIIEEERFSNTHKLLIVTGGLFWLILLLDLFSIL